MNKKRKFFFKMVFSEIFSHKIIFIFMILCVGITSFVFTMFFNFKFSAESFITKMIKKFQPSLILLPSEGQFIPVESLTQIARGYSSARFFPEAETFAKTNFGFVGVLGIEIEEGKDFIRGKLKGRLPFSDNEVLLGGNVAWLNSLKLGDIISVENTRLIVRGIIETGTEIDNRIIISLKEYEKIFNTRGVSRVKVFGEIPEKSLPRIEGIVFVRTGELVEDKRVRFTKGVTDLVLIIALITAVVTFVSLFYLNYSHVMKRQEEFGILVCLGAKNNFILRMIGFEIFIVWSGGVTAGVISGILLSTLLSFSILQSFPPISYKPILFSLFINLFYLITPVWFAIYLILRLKPAEIIRGE